MADGGTGATARSIRALFDLPRYVLVTVERWAGWGRLTLVPKNTRFRCPRCRIAVGDGQPCRRRLLRDLDIGRRHMEVRVQVRVRQGLAELGYVEGQNFFRRERTGRAGRSAKS